MRTEGMGQNKCSSKIVDLVMNTKDKNTPEPNALALNIYHPLRLVEELLLFTM